MKTNTTSQVPRQLGLNVYTWSCNVYARSGLTLLVIGQNRNKIGSNADCEATRTRILGRNAGQLDKLCSVSLSIVPRRRIHLDK